jgi:hypothetical protein
MDRLTMYGGVKCNHTGARPPPPEMSLSKCVKHCEIRPKTEAWLTLCASWIKDWRPELNEVCNSWAVLVTSGVCRLVTVSFNLSATDWTTLEIPP